MAAAYPKAAAESGLTGWVHLRVLVLKDGSIAEVVVADDSGLGPEFRQAATDAVREWTFLAASLDNEEVACWGEYAIGFSPPLPEDEARRLDSRQAAAEKPQAALDTAASALDSEAEADTAQIQYEADEVDLAPTLTAKVDPQYPPAAKLTGDTGSVTVRILIDSTGGVREVQVQDVTNKGKGFEAAALAAVRRWRFDPGRQQDRAVSVWQEEVVTFALPVADGK